MRWFWSLFGPGGREFDPRIQSGGIPEVTKAEFEASWTAWKTWAKMEELP
jgi:hypothetical protein